MAKEPIIALVVHTSLMQYFSPEFSIEKPVVSHSSILGLPGMFGQPLNAHAPYAYRYLFGLDGYRGILRDYIAHGCQLNVIDEGYFKYAFDELVPNYAGFDFQLSGNIDTAYPRALLQYGKGVIGWAPPVLGSKKFQAVALNNAPLTAHVVPRQIHLSTLGYVEYLAGQSLESYFPSQYVIAKPFYSSRSRMLDGSDYRILHTSCWHEFAQEMLANPDWFDGVNGIVLMEFVQTEDPYADNRNAVVHKINLPAGFCGSEFDEWPLACDKFVGTVKLERARHSVQPFGAVLDEHWWMDGSLEQYRTVLKDILQALLPAPCLVSIDLVIRPSGKVAFLELNKLAGSFGNDSGTSLSSLERYMAFAVPYLLSKRNWLDKFDAYTKTLEETIPLLAAPKPLPYPSPACSV